MSSAELKMIDAHVGRQLKLRRTFLGMSQEKLGNAMDLTFQQIQKYEKGFNRIGAGRLWEISKILNVPISYFFDNLDASGTGLKTIPYGAGLAEERATYDANPLNRKESVELLRAFYRIKDPMVAKRVIDLVKAMAAASEGEDL